MRFLKCCVAIMAISATLGCGKRPTGYYKAVTMLPGGRMVSAISDSGAPRCDSQAKAGPTIQVSDKSFVFLQHQVMVNGQPAGDIPADTRHITIVDRDGTVEITADNTVIYHFLR